MGQWSGGRTKPGLNSRAAPAKKLQAHPVRASLRPLHPQPSSRGVAQQLLRAVGGGPDGAHQGVCSLQLRRLKLAAAGADGQGARAVGDDGGWRRGGEGGGQSYYLPLLTCVGVGVRGLGGHSVGM